MLVSSPDCRSILCGWDSICLSFEAKKRGLVVVRLQRQSRNVTVCGVCEIAKHYVILERNDRELMNEGEDNILSRSLGFGQIIRRH